MREAQRKSTTARYVWYLKWLLSVHVIFCWVLQNGLFLCLYATKKYQSQVSSLVSTNSIRNKCSYAESQPCNITLIYDKCINDQSCKIVLFCKMMLCCYMPNRILVLGLKFEVPFHLNSYWNWNKYSLIMIF